MGISSIEQGKGNRKNVYDFIVKFITKNGYAPSVREICDGTDLKSTSSVYNHLMVLERMGKIHMKANKTRAISLVGYKLVKEEEEDC